MVKLFCIRQVTLTLTIQLLYNVFACFFLFCFLPDLPGDCIKHDTNGRSL